MAQPRPHPTAAGTHTGRDGVIAAFAVIASQPGTLSLEVLDVLTGERYGGVLYIHHRERDGTTLDARICLIATAADGQLTEVWEHLRPTRLRRLLHPRLNETGTTPKNPAGHRRRQRHWYRRNPPVRSPRASGANVAHGVAQRRRYGHRRAAGDAAGPRRRAAV